MVTKNKVKGKDIPPSYYEKLAMAESSNNPLAKAECPPGVNCTASGLYQFTEKTWNEMVKQEGLDYTLEDRFDPDKSLEVVKMFTQRNKNYLERNLGRDVTENELYLAHFLGMGGSRKMLKAYQEFPELTADRVLGKDSVNSNPNVFLNKDGSVKTLRELYKWSANKFGVKGVEVPKDDAIWSVDERGNYINLNPEFATEAERQASNYMKQQYINTLYPETDVTNNTNTATSTEQTPQQTKESVETEEKPQWKQELDKKQEERDTVFDFSAKGALNTQTVDYNRQPVSVSAQSNSFQDGGTKEDPPTEVYYGTPEYEKAYKEGRLQGQELDEVVVTADKRTGKNISEDYPFYNELSEQEKEYFRDSSPIGTQIRAKARDGEGVTADKASAMGAQILQGAGSALQVPQSAMVEGVEALRGNEYDFNSVLPGNKQRVPSDAWGYDTEGLSWHHPKSIANFAMDVVLDPENIAGAGIVARKPLQKGITKTGQALTTETPLKDIWKLNPQARKAFKNVDEQPHWLKGFQEEWNPTTPEQLQEMQNFLNKADEEWSKVIFNQDGANQKLVKYNKQRRKEQHKKNIGEDYSQDKINKIGQQIDKELGIDKTPLKSFINKLGRGSFGDVFEVEGAKAIKRIHSSEDLPINIKDIANKYKSLPKELQERVVVPFSAHGEGVGKIELMKKIEGAKDMKNAFSIDNKNVDNVIKDIKALNDKGIYVDLSNPDNILLDPKTNKATFLDLNTDKNIMDVTNYGKNTIVEKIKESVENLQFQDGGAFPISSKGLYDYPNQPVVVPTKDGKITMKGIDYPVFGIANTGEEVLMQPNKEYHFKGATEVLEIPQFQDGGENIKEMTKAYIKSPKYRERLKSSGYTDIDKEIEYRLNNINNTETIYQNDIPSFLEQIELKSKNIPYSEVGSIYDRKNKKVIVDKKQSKDEGVPIKSIEAHEYAHSELDPNKENYDYRDIGIKSTRLNTYDNLNLKHRIKKEAYEKNSHNSFPDENKADLNAFRYELKDFYDAGTENFTKEHLKKSKNSVIKKRLLKNYTEEDLIWLMNNIADINNKTNTTRIV